MGDGASAAHGDHGVEGLSFEAPTIPKEGGPWDLLLALEVTGHCSFSHTFCKSGWFPRWTGKRPRGHTQASSSSMSSRGEEL